MSRLPAPTMSNVKTNETLRFGLVATGLELIPFASMIFSFTNTVGAALWAADIEKKDSSMTDSTAPTLRDTAKKAE